VLGPLDNNKPPLKRTALRLHFEDLAPIACDAFPGTAAVAGRRPWEPVGGIDCGLDSQKRGALCGWGGTVAVNPLLLSGRACWIFLRDGSMADDRQADSPAALPALQAGGGGGFGFTGGKLPSLKLSLFLQEHVVMGLYLLASLVGGLVTLAL
jgi:hypothetical protein